MDTVSEYYLGERREVAALLPETFSTVLEIGCGSGGFRRNILGRPHEYWGVEPTPAAEEAKQHLDVVIHGIYSDVERDLPDAKFDLIICNDVIEHMVDHDAFFRSIKTKLAPGGSLVASIPNVRYLWNLWEVIARKDWEYKPEGILDRTHLRFFTSKSLRRTLVMHGFKINKFIGLNKHRGSLLRRPLIALARMLLGNDIQYLQFGFRVTL